MRKLQTKQKKLFNLPNVRPWKAPSNDIIETLGQPGALLNIDDCSSSSVNAFPWRVLFAYHIHMALKAFSFEHEPHIIGWTCSRPLGAIGRSIWSICLMNWGVGWTPSAGRFTNWLCKTKEN